MKKLAVVISIMVLGISAFGQGKFGKDSAECIKYLSYYSEYLKQNNFTDAAPCWRQAMSLCPPTANQNLLINGTKILRHEIAVNGKNKEKCQQLIDSLLMLHDIRAQYYPKYATKTMDNKAIDIQKYLKGDKETCYQKVGEIVDQIKGACSPSVYVNHFQTAVLLYKENKLTADDIMGLYTKLSEYMNASANNDIASAKAGVEQLLADSGVASCEKLIELYTPRYEASSNDKNIMTNMVTMLSKSECFDSDLYLKACESLNSLDPSAKSAYFLYKLYSSRDKNSDAAAALSKAIEMLDKNNPEEAKLATDYSMELATFYFKKLGSGAKAAEMAKNVVAMDPSMAGKAYLLIGTIWGSAKCGGNEVESRAHFWVAVDYMKKAKDADPSLADDANKLIGQYSRYFPQQADAFMYDIIDGGSYSVSCNGMHESTVIRTLK